MNKTAVAQQAKTANFLPPAQDTLQRKCVCGNHTGTGGECAGCRKKKNGLQRKLAIGASNDPLEREADRVADQMIAAPANSNADGAPLRIQRFAGQLTEPADTAPASVSRVLENPGRPLEPELKEDMEQRFGYDFSQVRVHSGDAAEQSAHDVNAQAYTAGHNIVFATGQFVPGTHEGRRLIAHELTHVVQQTYSSGIRTNRSYEKRGLPPVSAVSAKTEADEAAVSVANAAAFIRLRSLAPSRLQKKSAGRKDVCLEVGDPKTSEGRRRAGCASEEMKKKPADCEFTRRQKNVLNSAKREAASRVRRALLRVETGEEGNRLANDLAAQLFIGEAPSAREVKAVLKKVHDFLSGSGVEFAGKGCGEPTCHTSATTAYVTAAGTMPIYICPLAFVQPETLYRTIIHEALHWSGIDADPSTPEGYCEKADCVTPCLGKEAADAWAHFLACLGEPLELRKSFMREIERSVEELP